MNNWLTLPPALVRVLERHGIATLFAVVLLAAGWRIGDAHLVFLNSQITEMQIQTKLLQTIADTGGRQEAQLVDLRDTIAAGHHARTAEHDAILRAVSQAK